jgi:predicted Zn-dependent protease
MSLFSFLAKKNIYSEPLDNASLRKLQATYERNEEEGEEEAKKLIDAFPDSAFLSHVLAQFALKREDWVSALAYSSMALSLDPDNPNHYRLLAFIMDKNGFNDFSRVLTQIGVGKYVHLTGSKPSVSPPS